MALPFVDEHRTTVDAPAEVVWDALVHQLRRAFASPAAAYCRLVRADPDRVTGRFPDAGATVPGFRVDAVDPAARLRLTGRHHFSAYALEFALDPAETATVLRAATYARFPGLGAVYRLGVVGSGGHGVLMRRLLRGVRRRAESS